MTELRGPRVAGPVWPPRPPDVSTNATFRCKATGGRMVGYIVCTSICSIPAKNRACIGCACEWRVCPACALQPRVFSQAIRITDPSSDLCDFHRINGADAVREELEEEEPDIRLKPVRLSVPEEHGEEEDDRLLFLLPDIPVLKDFADKLGNMNPNRLRIARMLSLSVPLEEIARTSRTTRESIGAIILSMGTTVGLTYPPECPVTRSEYCSRVLAAAFRLMGT